MFISVNMIHLVFSPPGFPARSAACIDGWDGWMDGWMDGMDGMDGFVRTSFCFAFFTKTACYLSLIISMLFRKEFKPSFENLFFSFSAKMSLKVF